MKSVLNVCFMECVVSVSVKSEFPSLTAGIVAATLLPVEGTAW